MREMTTHERMTRMYQHREADRVPITDLAWPSTVERWRREGLPENVAWQEFFGLDRFASITVDNSPRFPEQVLEETEEYIISTSPWGATRKCWKHAGGVPEFLRFEVTDRDTWLRAKTRMKPDPDRINWAQLRRDFAKWREEGRWIYASLLFGFDVTHSGFIGTQQTLMAMVDDPEWISDIITTELELAIELYEVVWKAGYHFDAIMWPDDMGYKQHQFFSLPMYRQLIKPAHRRAAEWAHARGLKVFLHACGDINPFIPDLIEIGVDMLNPLEVKAGMDPIALKKQYGDRLAFQGGINAVNFTDPDALHAEMRRVIPVMKQDGGYVIASDHSVPQSVSLDQFKEFVNLAKILGSYD